MDHTFQHKNPKKPYLLGVDTGSSKTYALISDISGRGRMIGFGESGCGNYEVVGVDGFIKTVNDAVNDAISSAGVSKTTIAAMGFGFSGYDWPSEKPIMVEAIRSLQINSPYQFVNDAMLGLIAGSTEGWGIAADAGTGNNIIGRDKAGKIGRITGNSIRFGEFGGASEMVWRAMLAVTYAWTKRGPETRLTQLFIDYARVENEFELIEGLAMDKIQLDPELAINIIQLANEGDSQAQETVRFSAIELALNVNAVIRQLKFDTTEFEIILMGSVFKAGDIYIKPFQETILKFAPKAKFVQLLIPPVVGAVLLAAEVLRVPPRS
ncbi:MAG: BadF/BadG/BcrA/BcrD ATPase family protein [Chloroflexota bacterium]|nr:BadF/BadG/BcrA/BcrD ATPase family protein [Chloroflexota bacterium]